MGNMILIASSIIANYLLLPALLLNSVKLASSRQMPNSRTRKAGVTGSSPVAGSIAQDSRLRAAFFVTDFRRTSAGIRPLGGLRV